jgi:putative hydrolase of the HAD superfamily
VVGNVNSRRQDVVPKAIIFDLDDTLINSNRRQAWHQTVRGFTQRLEGRDADTVANVIADTAAEFWADPECNRKWGLRVPEGRLVLLRKALLSIGLNDADLLNDLTSVFVAGRESTLALFPGARKALEQLVEQSVRLAMLTNGYSDTQRKKIERFNLAKHFEYIQVQEEFGVGKPDAAAFQNVMGVLELSAEEVWMVGDNLELDMAAAQRVGIWSIWHDHAGNGLPANHAVCPDHVISSILEVPALLEAVHLS